MVTFQALLTLYSQSFFDNNKEIYLHCLKYADKLNSACCSNDKDAIRKTYDEMQKQFASCNIRARMKYSDEKNGNNPMFAFTRHCMVLILEMPVFLKSLRIADWELHLASLKSHSCQLRKIVMREISENIDHTRGQCAPLGALASTLYARSA